MPTTRPAQINPKMFRDGWQRSLLCIFSCSVGLLLADAVQAQNATFVTSAMPVRILVGAPAGGTTDTMARSLAQALGTQLGRTVVVENKPGAGGNVAAEMVARAVPDGNTLLMSFTSHAINASLYPSLPFDPIKDFTPLTMVSSSPSILVAHPSLPVKNVADLIRLAKEKPGQLNFAIGAAAIVDTLSGWTKLFRVIFMLAYIVIAKIALFLWGALILRTLSRSTILTSFVRKIR
jgi:tripartite-type tricarboxylate transporter receptor subunit TctC